MLTVEKLKEVKLNEAPKFDCPRDVVTGLKMPHSIEIRKLYLLTMTTEY